MKRSNASERSVPVRPAGKPAGDPSDDDIRIARLAPIPGLLRELRCNPEAVLTAAGFDPAVFSQPDARVPYLRAAEMLAACAEASATPHFGLLLGCRFDLSMLGVIDPLLRNSSSVRTALGQLVRHLHMTDRGATAFVSTGADGETAVGYNVFLSDAPGAVHIYATALASIYGIMRTLCGPEWQPKRVLFAHVEPADIEPYHQLFRAPLHFNAPRSEIVFSDEWLDQPINGADTRRRLSAERIALAAETRQDSHYVSRVRRCVYELLMSGEISARLVCARLGIHERVLRRHLHAEGTSIKQAIGSARHEIACQLLANTRLSLSEIAEALCYSDATAFSRAFCHIAGMPPKTWRGQAGQRLKGPLSSAARKPTGRIPGSARGRRGTGGQKPNS